MKVLTNLDPTFDSAQVGWYKKNETNSTYD